MFWWSCRHEVKPLLNYTRAPQPLWNKLSTVHFYFITCFNNWTVKSQMLYVLEVWSIFIPVVPQHSSVCFMENLMSSCYQVSLFACEFEWRRCQKWEHKSHCHCWWEYDRVHIRNVCQRSTVFSSAEFMWMLLLLNRGCKRARVVGCTLSKLRGSRRFNLI